MHTTSFWSDDTTWTRPRCTKQTSSWSSWQNRWSPEHRGVNLPEICTLSRKAEPSHEQENTTSQTTQQQWGDNRPEKPELFMRWGLCAPAQRLHQHPTFAVPYSCLMLSTWVSPKFQKGTEHQKQTLAKNFHLVTYWASVHWNKSHSDSSSNSCIQGTNNSPGVGHRIRPTGKENSKNT